MSEETKQSSRPSVRHSISIIAAVANNGVMGKDGTLPWRLPADLKHFKTLTMGKPVIMGRKTYDSIGKPLAGRKNIVMTRDDGFHAEGCEVVHSAEEALAAAGAAEEVMVIGGASVYALLMPRADRLYLTLVDGEFTGDVLFPDVDLRQWEETSREYQSPDARNPWGFAFVIYNRREGKRPDKALPHSPGKSRD